MTAAVICADNDYSTSDAPDTVLPAIASPLRCNENT